MQHKEPTFGRRDADPAATADSPAFARRRQLLGGQSPAGEGAPHQPSLLSEAELEPGPDPDIPPMPAGATPFPAGAEGEPVPRARRLRRRPVLLGAAAVLLVVALGWWLLPFGEGSGGNGEVPLVTAEVGPAKVRPKDEGGLQVPNQDISVYNELTGKPPPIEPEVLLPGPEQPMTPPSPPALASGPPLAAQATAPSTTLSTPTIGTIEPGPAQATETPAPASSPTPSPPTTATGSAPGGSEEAPPSAPAEAAPPTKPTKSSARLAATTGAFRVQLAAVSSADAARAAWAKMTKAHPDILKGLSLKVVKIDRGGAALYRVQGGPLADRDAAESVCGRLEQQDQACLVVAP